MTKEIELRERAARFQVGKRIILRKAGQDLFQTLREIEKRDAAAHAAVGVGRMAAARTTACS